jgi:glycosyltransferase involved in cell wall biosynthesis
MKNRETSGMPAEGISLRIPDNDSANPKATILIPTLDEELTISQFIQWCHQGISRTGIDIEILIVDSSTDATPEIALELGARVLQVPKLGLGRAYIDAIPFVRGDYVILGDADLTYDFRRIDTFIRPLESGYDFAMGSRWKGNIEKGSMPFLHQYFGTPLTTWILNRIFGSNFSDIHCGMRAISSESLRRMNLTSQSWEYASEMIVKSIKMNLNTTEVPVDFYRDTKGRVSHHVRSGWLSPFRAAWTNLRMMFTYGADFFMIKPGILFFCLGLLICLPLSLGPINFGHLQLNLYWMLIGVAVTVLGLESFFFGLIARIITSPGTSESERWRRKIPYNLGILTGFSIFFVGVVLDGLLAIWYFTHKELLPKPDSSITHVAILGILLLILGFSLFCFTLVVQATGSRFEYPGDRDKDQLSFSKNEDSNNDESVNLFSE